MYMTVLKADFDSLKNRKYLMDFNNGEFMHKWMTSQTNTRRSEEKILYRIDRTKDAVYLYIQSIHEFPEKNIEQAGMRKLKSFPVDISLNKTIVFRLFCSTEHCVNDRRQFIQDPEKRKEWLVKRLSPFMVNMYVQEVKTDTIMIKGRKKIIGTEFIGEGVVIDADAFLAAVENGIGREKSYGMGLLLFKEKG